MKKILKENWVFLIGFVATAIVYLSRLMNLTIIPVFADEAIYIRWAQVMKSVETLRFLPLSDGKEPLFMWSIIPLFKFVADPLTAGRLISVLSGFGSLVGLYVLSYTIFKNKKAALLTSFIYAISPFTFFFDRLSLVDSMLSMFGIWTFILSYLSIKYGRLDLAMIAGFFLGGAWLTKSSALFFALMLPVFLLIAGWKNNFKENKFIFLKSCFLFLVTTVIGYGFFNILRLGPNFHLIATRNMDYVYPVSHILVSPFDPLKVFLTASAKWIGMMGPWPLYLFAVAGIIFNFRKYWKEILIVLVWFLVPIFVNSEFAKAFTARYILYSIPYLIVLSGTVALQKFNTTKKLFFYLTGALFIIISVRFDYLLVTDPYKANLPRVERSGYLEDWTAGQGIKETADYLITEDVKNSGKKIVIGTEGYFGTLPDGLQVYLNSYPEITAIGVGLNFDSLPSQLVNSQKAGNDTYLLVNKSRFRNTPEKLGLKLINEYPKGQKPDGTIDSLLLFQVTNEALKLNSGN